MHPITYSFFGLDIAPATLIGKTLILMLAALLGGMIGLERQWHGNAAGLRTHILVCVGSAVITMTSVEIGNNPGGAHIGDPARLSAQIVSGIGFLGAGAILRDGTTVHGLTTAASIWATAGIGIALGANPHLGELAVVATGIVLVTLFLLARLESLMKLDARHRTLTVCLQEIENAPGHLLEMLSQSGITVQSLQQSVDTSNAGDIVRRFVLRVHLPGGFNRNQMNGLLASEKTIRSFQWE